MQVRHGTPWGDAPDHCIVSGEAEFAARALDALDALPLEALHGMPLECDGASQALSQILTHVGIDHEVHLGSLTVDGVGHIPLHWWVVLPDGAHCDIRARMWIGDAPEVPHGVFFPTTAHRYQSKAAKVPVQAPVLFGILTSQDLESFVARLTSAPTDQLRDSCRFRSS